MSGILLDGDKARKGIAFEPAGDQSLDPFACDTLLTAIVRARAVLFDRQPFEWIVR